ncbi:hypothetical protein WR25_10460 [Diploscapter pachys]|uniref:beta-N-acetylhexosaminidase n=1 Tax=Diploscapter pachys TaxID=2018661 RepID=A0A2A2KXP8_9BILA|nr:hypothetical protein WR25_10460 [Diploscapter pachys]
MFRMFQMIDKARPNTKKIVWQEVLDQNVPATGTIAHVWKGDTIDAIMQEMASVTKAGHNAILSSCWYLNYIKYGADWRGVDGNSADRVLGGEAAIWGEFVDGTNLIPRLWPRASAVAERLWSDPKQTTSPDMAWPRLHEFRCKLLARGHATEPPNDPDYCPFEWNPPYQER